MIKYEIGGVSASTVQGPWLAAAGFDSSSRSWWQGWLTASNDSDHKETVRVRRRRRGGSTESGDRKRAEAPRRRRKGGLGKVFRPSGSGGASGGSRPPVFSGGKLPGGGKPSLLVIAVIVIMIICACPLILFFGPGDAAVPSLPDSSSSEAALPAATPVPLESTLQEAPVITPEPFTPPPPASEGQTWLVMLYQDADDKILEQDIYLDLNEAELVGSSDRVHIVAQVDRYRAGYRGDGNWSAARRFYVKQDNDLNRVQSQQVVDLGEVNMADGDTLVDFVTWAVDTFPADKHVLIMSDHGMGWPGGWSDPEPGGSGDRAIPLSAALGDKLYLMELDEALTQIRSNTGVEKFELIGMDACLMGHLEVFSALAPHARYAVASQEVEPALGWAYTGFLQALRANPDMNGADLGRLIIQSYIQDDQRIVDDQARAEFLRQGSPSCWLCC